MKTYEFLEEVAIADIAFRAYGKSLEEVFGHSAQALFAVMVDLEGVKHKETEVLEISEDTIDHLLFDFLSDLIFLKDTKQMVYSDFTIRIEHKDDKYHLKAEMKGEKIEPKRHVLHSEAKAITMHMFKIEEKNGEWEAQVVVDV